MQLSNPKKFFIILVSLLVLLGFYMIFKRYGNLRGISMDNNKTSTTTTQIPGTGLSLESNGDYTITEVPVEGSATPTLPDLNRNVVFGNVDLTPEVKKLITDKILTLQSNLKKDPKNISFWNDLGIYQKMAGDYSGALISWKYAGDVSNDSVSLGNIGNLYAYYLKDKKLAESYYKKAISRSPTTAYLYIQLSKIYQDVFMDKAKALDILEQGLLKIPGDSGILEAKKNLK